MRIHELIAKSRDSRLTGYNFSDGILSIHLDIDEIDDSMIIEIVTSLVHGNPLSKENDVLM
jgi:hypothetical protein